MTRRGSVGRCFSTTAFGKKMNVSISEIGCEGRISVQQFVYPVLAIGTFDPIVSTDLHLADALDGRYRWVVISGPSGGGQSVAM